MSKIILIPAVVLLLHLGIQPHLLTKIVVNSSKPDEHIEIVAYGGGGTLKLLNGKARRSADTIWTTTPAEMSLDLAQGELRIVSLKDDRWIDAQVLVGTHTSFSISAQRILVKQDELEVRVSSFTP